MSKPVDTPFLAGSRRLPRFVPILFIIFLVALLCLHPVSAKKVDLLDKEAKVQTRAACETNGTSLYIVYTFRIDDIGLVFEEDKANLDYFVRVGSQPHANVTYIFYILYHGHNKAGRNLFRQRLKDEPLYQPLLAPGVNVYFQYMHHPNDRHPKCGLAADIPMQVLRKLGKFDLDVARKPVYLFIDPNARGPLMIPTQWDALGGQWYLPMIQPLLRAEKPAVIVGNRWSCSPDYHIHTEALAMDAIGLQMVFNFYTERVCSPSTPFDKSSTSQIERELSELATASQYPMETSTQASLPDNLLKCNHNDPQTVLAQSQSVVFQEYSTSVDSRSTLLLNYVRMLGSQ